jgi:hypothetical protein
MMMRVKLYTLTDEFAVAELFGPLTVEENLSYAQFRRFVEDKKFNPIGMRHNIQLQKELGELTPSPPDYAALEPTDNGGARAFA